MSDLVGRKFVANGERYEVIRAENRMVECRVKGNDGSAGWVWMSARKARALSQPSTVGGGND